MKKISQDIHDGKFQKVYLITGNEPYLRRTVKTHLIDAVTHGDTMNVRIFRGDGKEKIPELPELKDFTDTLPFFAEKRLLVLENTGLFRTASEGYTEWIGTLPDTACVIFFEDETDKRNKLYKKTAECGYVCVLDHPEEEELKKWILGMVGQQKLNITRSAYEHFRELTGNEMDRIRSELMKLCDYCADRGVIEEADVDLIVTPVIESRIFLMVEAVSAGDHEKAMKLYYDLIALREPPLRILFLLERQLNQLMLVREMTEKRARREEIASALGIKPFIAGKLSAQAGKYPLTVLKDNLRLSAELEEAVKTGNLTDTTAVELLIHKLTLK